MKNLITCLLLLLALLLPANAAAYDFEVDGIYYNINGNEATVTSDGYRSYSGIVNIPDVVTYNGTTYSVTAIGENAFRGSSDMTAVTIPNSVVTIGACAFLDCDGLTSVTIPNSVTRILQYAFDGCDLLKSVTIPNSLTYIGWHAFRHCRSLTSITIPHSVTCIKFEAFKGCYNMKDVYSYITDPLSLMVENDIFKNIDDNYSGRTLHVPYGTVYAYQADEHWFPYFEQIVEMDPEMELIGDVNFDGQIDIADINAVIDIILGIDGFTMIADVNRDGEVTIADVNAIMDIILGGNEEPEPEPEHEWVDLGLPSGTLWATMNIGANTREDYGDYFAWGETEPKEVYTWGTYKWCNGSKNTLTKYNTNSDYGIVDGKTELEPEDDAAYVNWGPSWRTPTTEQQAELISKCSWSRKTINGVKGYMLTGPNGKKLFLPAAGYRYEGSVFQAGTYGSFWSSSCYTSNGISSNSFSACDMGFNGDSFFLNGSLSYRYFGHSVRAVRVPPADERSLYVEQESLDLGDVPVGETGTGELSIVNNTSEDLTLTVTAVEPFSLKQDEGSASSIVVVVPGNSSVPVTVMFPATMPGEYSSNVTFRSPVLDGGESVIPVQARAYDYGVPQYVDLGLPSGTLWATMNVGSNNPEDYGDYFAWGETEPKNYYDWSTYKWCNGGQYSLTKYCTNSSYGTVDNKKNLDLEDDAAYVNLGRSWRMPTKVQQEELINRCKWTWTTRNGVNGHLVTGPNGKAIFIPAAGLYSGNTLTQDGTTGLYWTRTLESSDPAGAWGMSFGDHSQNWSYTYRLRYYGESVRPVRISTDESPDLYIEQFRINFGEVRVKESRTAELTIVNNTDESQTVTATTTMPFMFNDVSGNPLNTTIEVPGNSNISLSVKFTATNPGDFDGNVTFNSPALDGGQCIVPLHASAFTDSLPMQEYIDLGLPSGTLWATRNVGATRTEDYGDYFAWGETTPKKVYNWPTYKWCDGDRRALTKYCTDSDYGTVDGKTELELEDDAAYVNCGPSWRMPTTEQQQELCDQCSWQWTSLNSVDGYLVTGPNGNTLFLPAAGSHYNTILPGDQGWIGYYWSRTLSANSTISTYGLYFNSGFLNGQSDLSREQGLPVRAVCVSPAEPFYIEQKSLDIGEVPVGETRTGELTIVNNTNKATTVTATVNSPFLFKRGENSASSLTVVVPSYSSSTVTMMFKATISGDFNGRVTFSSPVFDGGLCVIPVHASAISLSQHEYVDLGLPSGTLWATTNVGASRPEDSGDYFAWGETEPKDNYNWSTYKWCNGSEYSLTKYNNINYNGPVDNRMELDLEDDAAYMNWGTSWRMPTLEQMQELCDKCSWQWTQINGVKGRLVTGPNGNTIFLPAAGGYSSSVYWLGSCGYYWTRTLYSRDILTIEAAGPGQAYIQFMSSSKKEIWYDSRYVGNTVRAVRVSPSERPLYIEQQSLNLGEVPVGESRTGELTIVNNTKEEMTLTAIADAPLWFKQDENSVSSQTIVVPGNSSSKVTVMFTATTPGEFNGNVIFCNSAFDGGQCVIPVHANAIASQHEYVDLGLPSGTLWATVNVGANNPEDYGYYFAWGETEPKEVYDWSTYKWIDNNDKLTKYCTRNSYGTIDNMTELQPEDDAAYVNWGPTWRMPSMAQQDELRFYCTWTWTSINGVNGYQVTGPNGASLFLPVAGCYSIGSFLDEGTHGYYWSRSLYSSNPYSAYSMYTYSDDYMIWRYQRSYGYPVRAVRASQD